MLKERYSWQVCFDAGDVWENIETHETRAEAEYSLVLMSERFPDAFVVRQTLTRIDQAHETATAV